MKFEAMAPDLQNSKAGCSGDKNRAGQSYRELGADSKKKAELVVGGAGCWLSLSASPRALFDPQQPFGLFNPLTGVQRVLSLVTTAFRKFNFRALPTR